jgi:copper chaperone NosL
MGFQSGRRSVSRRQTVHAVGAGIAAGLAGCLGTGSASVPEPVDLSGQKTDYRGGMVIGNHGGPNGQVFYADAQPEPRQGSAESSPETENVAWFHTLAHGLFPYHFRMVDQGAEATVVYVTDYSRVDWEVSGESGREQMPAPTAPESFGDAAELTYAVETGVMGGMGPDLMPFSDPDGAGTFADRHGGRTVTYQNIDQALVNEIRTTQTE